jgi:hypothetical protein
LTDVEIADQFAAQAQELEHPPFSHYFEGFQRAVAVYWSIRSTSDFDDLGNLAGSGSGARNVVRLIRRPETPALHVYKLSGAPRFFRDNRHLRLWRNAGLPCVEPVVAGSSGGAHFTETVFEDRQALRDVCPTRTPAERQRRVADIVRFMKPFHVISLVHDEAMSWEDRMKGPSTRLEAALAAAGLSVSFDWRAGLAALSRKRGVMLHADLHDRNILEGRRTGQWVLPGLLLDALADVVGPPECDFGYLCAMTAVNPEDLPANVRAALRADVSLDSDLLRVCTSIAALAKARWALDDPGGGLVAADAWLEQIGALFENDQRLWVPPDAADSRDLGLAVSVSTMP